MTDDGSRFDEVTPGGLAAGASGRVEASGLLDKPHLHMRRFETVPETFIVDALGV